MALKDVWKLKDYIVNSAKQYLGAYVDTLNYEVNPLTLLKLAKQVSEILPDKKELTGEEVIQYQQFISQAIVKGSQEGTVPNWMAAVLSFAVAIKSLTSQVSISSDITLEKNVAQPLRKQIRPSIPPVQDLIQAELRGVLKPDQVKELIARLGYTDEHINVFRKLAQYIPTAQDIVLFALREVYDAGTVSKFGMDDKLSDVLSSTKADRAAAGLPDETFKKYWAAHWDLPSVNQGFEMLHRGLIDRGELEMLLKAKDVMPFWRDKLLNTSYNLLTRVDVRRMHKLKIISDTQLVKEYEKMGHSKEDAQKLAVFTIEYNKNPEEYEKTEKDKEKVRERDLTKTEITGSFRAHLITEEQAKSMLLGIGYAPDETDLIIGRETFQQEKTRLTSLIKAYENIYKKGIAGPDAIRKELQNIPLDKKQIDLLFEEWDLERVSTLDMPTRAEILRWYKKDLISEERARELLTEIGTQEMFIDLYIKDTK